MRVFRESEYIVGRLKIIWAYVRRLLRTRTGVALATLVLTTVSVGLIFGAIWHGYQGGLMRWSTGGGLEETPEFLSMIGNAQDQGRWQSGTRHTQSERDEALRRVSVYSVPNVHPMKNLPTLRELGDQAQVKVIEAIEHASGSNSRPWDDLSVRPESL